MFEKVTFSFIPRRYSLIFSLEALVAAKVSHNDIKPSNYLADWPQGQAPTVTNLKIYLTDFGMVDQSGGTPVFCSPEGLTGATLGLSDLFSLGRVYLFLVLENRSLFYTLVFESILTSRRLRAIRKVLKNYPILNLITEMTHFEKNKRVTIAQVQQRLTNMKIEIITKANIENLLTAQGHSGITIQDYQVDEMMAET